MSYCEITSCDPTVGRYVLQVGFQRAMAIASRVCISRLLISLRTKVGGVK